MVLATSEEPLRSINDSGIRDALHPRNGPTAKGVYFHNFHILKFFEVVCTSFAQLSCIGAKCRHAQEALGGLCRRDWLQVGAVRQESIADDSLLAKGQGKHRCVCGRSNLRPRRTPRREWVWPRGGCGGAGHRTQGCDFWTNVG